MGIVGVTVTDGNGCIGTDEVFVDFILGVSEISTANIKVYPNPVHNKFNVDLEGWNTTNVVIDLIELTGKTIQTQIIENAFNKQTVVFYTEQLNKGVYILKISDGNETITTKLVVD